VPVGQVQNESRDAIGFVVGIVPYLALTFAGSVIAVGEVTLLQLLGPAAPVDKSAGVSTAILPVTNMLILSYLVTVVVVIDNPLSPLSTTASLFPLTAPIATPVRWASGEVPTYQLAISMLLIAVTAVLFVGLASAPRHGSHRPGASRCEVLTSH